METICNNTTRVKCKEFMEILLFLPDFHKHLFCMMYEADTSGSVWSSVIWRSALHFRLWSLSFAICTDWGHLSNSNIDICIVRTGQVSRNTVPLWRSALSLTSPVCSPGNLDKDRVIKTTTDTLETHLYSFYLHAVIPEDRTILVG